jgi:hypothetical protein
VENLGRGSPVTLAEIILQTSCRQGFYNKKKKLIDIGFRYGIQRIGYSLFWTVSPTFGGLKDIGCF